MNSPLLLLLTCWCLISPSSEWSFSYSSLKSRFGYEVCDSTWIPGDMTKFREQFRRQVFGQPLVENLVSNAVAAHFKSLEPKKALVLSFHGWPGVGKNFVSSLLVESIFKEGLKSTFYKNYNARIDFTLESKLHEYQDTLRKDITNILAQCERSVFVFDEVDMMPPKVLDVLHPFIDYQEKVNNVDPRRAVFIFLSNRGGRDISDITFQLWKSNKERSTFRDIDFKEALTKAAFNEKGGLQFSDNINSYLINRFVPFLPLQLEHVKQCIEAEFLKRDHHNYQGDITSEVLQHVAFTKKDSPSGGLFAISGCKNIDSIVSTAFEKHYYNSHQHHEF